MIPDTNKGIQESSSNGARRRAEERCKANVSITVAVGVSVMLIYEHFTLFLHHIRYFPSTISVLAIEPVLK